MNEESINYYAIIPANVRYDPELTPNAKLLYGEITALCNAKGYCWATNSYFAKLYNVKPHAISVWISSLVKRGYIHSDVVYEGNTKRILERRITLTAAKPIVQKDDTYCLNKQYLLSKKNIPYCSENQYPIDQKVKENNTINNTYNNTINNNTVKASVEADFDYLWGIYPRKEGKKNALAAYKRAVKAGTTKQQVEDGIKRYIAYLLDNRVEARYVKKGDTFFRNECWNDSYNVEGVKTNAFNEYGGISAGYDTTDKSHLI